MLLKYVRASTSSPTVNMCILWVGSPLLSYAPLCGLSSCSLLCVGSPSVWLSIPLSRLVLLSRPRLVWACLLVVVRASWGQWIICSSIHGGWC